MITKQCGGHDHKVKVVDHSCLSGWLYLDWQSWPLITNPSSILLIRMLSFEYMKLCPSTDIFYCWIAGNEGERTWRAHVSSWILIFILAKTKFDIIFKVDISWPALFVILEIFRPPNTYLFSVRLWGLDWSSWLVDDCEYHDHCFPWLPLSGDRSRSLFMKTSVFSL